jgi:hypothetical protein
MMITVSRREKSMYLVFRRLLILSSPIALGFLETLHPVIRDAYTASQVLEHQVGWWMALQLLQIALACLLASAFSHNRASSRRLPAVMAARSEQGCWCWVASQGW